MIINATIEMTVITAFFALFDIMAFGREAFLEL